MSENNNFKIVELQPPDLLIIGSDSTEVLRISSEGKFYINGKEVTSEKEILDSLISWMQTGEQKLATAEETIKEFEREDSRLREELGMQRKIENKTW